MSEGDNKILIERLKKSIGKRAEVFLKDNNYSYMILKLKVIK